MKTLLFSKSLLVLYVFLVFVSNVTLSNVILSNVTLSTVTLSNVTLSNVTSKVTLSNVTLTTATVCVGECIKPTTLKTSVYRRMMGDWNKEDEFTTPFNKFRANDKKKISRSEIWKWDYWCQQQRKVGTCSEPTLRFYYDAVVDQCKSFKYSGCKENKNNFNTMEDCDRNCKGASYMEIKDIDETQECLLQPNSGLCVAMFKMFYYDINANECKPFIYGGCGGNANRFSTMYKCTRHCGNKVTERKRD